MTFCIYKVFVLYFIHERMKEFENFERCLIFYTALDQLSFGYLLESLLIESSWTGGRYAQKFMERFDFYQYLIASLTRVL